MSGSMVWTPAIQEALNTAVVNKFESGWAAAVQRISGLLNICGPRTSDAENVVALVVGKDFRMHLRRRGTDIIIEEGVNAYEHRARLGNYYRFVTVDRQDALYNKWNRVMASAEAAGASAAEAPTRAVEALVPLSLGVTCHTGEPYYSAAHPQKPGSSTTFPNLLDLGALDFDTYDTAVKTMAENPDEDGHACGSRPKVLAVGPAYKEIGREIVLNKRPKDYAGGDNLRADDQVELVVVPDWGDDLWAVFDTGIDFDMPYYYVEGRPIVVLPTHIDLNGAWEIEHQQLQWCVEGDIGVVLGNPRRSILVVEDDSAPAVAALIAKYRKKFDLNPQDFSLAA